ncbi:MAG TPA: hypothetical protein VFI60_10900 [Candidatus Acidoferrum sp.]|nr:hypothetical protein [Candidatus Acidoferrum sp.]
MKWICSTLLFVLTSFASVALAQSDMHKATDKVSPSEAERSFTLLKTLAGSWEGPVTLDPPQPEMDNGKPFRITLRVTSRGHAIVHEMQEAGTAPDPAKYDHPVTMLYLDGDRLTLIHYCDAGNRPRMVARTSPDGKRVEFNFQDLSGGNEYGHMYHAVFTAIDANHHLEDWTYMMPGDKPVHAHFDLQRVQ